VDRVAAVEQLGSRHFDLLVIGGGILGAGIADAATAHGLDVALVERGDFACATSSASSKLVHGGLRYLQMCDIRLVREAHEERRALMNVVAPHLVHRLPFVFPLYAHGPHRPWFVRTGVLLYSALARSETERPREREASPPARCRSSAPRACTPARSTPTRGRTTGA